MPLDGVRMKEKGEKRMCQWKWPVIFILCMGLFILHAQAYVICGPEKVTRGGVALYTPEEGKVNPDLDVDGVFGFYIKTPLNNAQDCDNYPNCSIMDCIQPNCSCYYGNPLIAGFTINPQTMTGAYGERPPYFPNQTGVTFDRLYGDHSIYPVVDRMATYHELVPNGEIYPSKGEWFVPFNGLQYYGLINTSKFNIYPIDIATLYPDELGKMGLKPGKYTIHFQEKDNPTRNASTDYSFEIVLGTIEVFFKNYATGQPIKSIPRGQKVRITGKNTDSNVTYLWLTGYGLPECGTGIFPRTLPVTSTSPTVISKEIMERPDSPFVGEYHSDGTWELVWDTSELPLVGGQSYSIYASSINPEEVLPLLPPRGSCTTTEKGICAFGACPYCEPLSDPATIQLTDLEPVDVVVDPSVATPCCCQGYPCGVSDSADKIVLKFKTGVSRLPVQIWMFGEGKVGEQGFLFTDKYRTLLDDEGTFEIDINQYLLEANNIKLCNLNEGKYTLLVQVPYVTSYGQEKFDVTLETSDFAQLIENAMFPHDQDPDRYYVVQAQPFYWTKAFPITGLGALEGGEALSKLKETLQKPEVRDRFATAEFSLKPSYCPDRKVVNFDADVKEGYAPLTVQFTDESSFTGTSYLWDFGDGTIGDGQNPTHTYVKPGTYPVRLTIVDDTGVSHNRLKSSFIVVQDATAKYFSPVADFTISKVANEPFSIQFIDQSYGATPLTSIWDFGDNSTSGEKSPKHQYASAGTYTVNLTVKDQYDKESTKTQDILVPSVSPPVPDFEFTINPNQMKQVQFTDKSQGEITSWKWTFGDGLGSSIQSPEHLYTTYGTFSVTLTVGNNAGSQSFTKEITLIDPKVSADFSWEDIGERTVRFLDNSKGLITEWTLEYGDGKVDQFTEAWDEVEHTYSQLGRYYAKLTVKNDYNKDSVTKQIDVLKRQ